MLITIILCLAIIAVAVWRGLWIRKQKESGSLIRNRRKIENQPTLVSTLGVLGTFAGITIGLLGFDSKNINESIPILLDGLKTAFFTSLLGMAGSLILSRLVSRYYDEADDGVSDINIAAGEITKAVKEMSDSIIQNNNQQAQIQAAYNNSMLSFIENVSEGLSSLSTGMGNANGSLSQLITLCTAMSVDTKALKETSATLDRNISELTTMTETNCSTQEEMLSEVQKFGDKLHNEVVEIEDQMQSTNKLLESKFAEFSELLQKSNTEALVEVMKNVTEEFNKQMNDLISRLVQENFEQLNKSVEQLNTWQQENKTMIASLTSQYKEMTENFEQTSTVLSDVSKDTQSLAGSGSKLQTIINALNAVIVEDEKFKEITANLSDSAHLNRQSMVEFKDAQSTLNQWLMRQRDFVEAVQALMAQLQDISKINDYAETFWKQTRSGMNDSVAILKNGSQTMQNQIDIINAAFYERINDTLAQLDNCIQKMVQHYDKR